MTKNELMGKLITLRDTAESDAWVEWEKDNSVRFDAMAHAYSIVLKSIMLSKEELRKKIAALRDVAEIDVSDRADGGGDYYLGVRDAYNIALKLIEELV